VRAFGVRPVFGAKAFDDNLVPDFEAVAAPSGSIKHVRGAVSQAQFTVFPLSSVASMWTHEVGVDPFKLRYLAPERDRLIAVELRRKRMMEGRRSGAVARVAIGK
jgi:hypothetical protein